MPSMSQTIHSMLAQSGYETFGITLPHSGGYNPNKSFNPSSINMSGGNSKGTSHSVQPMSTN